MASRSSPGGALLRASRVFSLPPALPKPGHTVSATAIFGADTATTPYPLRQAITTPQSSLARGDWGLKRPMPLRTTTKTGTPHIRIEALDAYEQVTDFGSAAEHTQTLKKWQEMGLPLMSPAIRNKLNTSQEYNRDSPKNVFESQRDTTVLPEEPQQIRDEGRWKFKGPWLAGMTEGDFNTYVDTKIRSQKAGFQNFVRAECVRTLNSENSRAATDSGEAAAETIEPITEANVTEEQLSQFTKQLRENEALRNKLICQYLDLPPMPAPELSDIARDSDSVTGYFEALKAVPKSSSPYADSGPPRTHPSGGLSYGRTTAHIHNHHVFGPQQHAPPVEARVVMPRNAGTGNFKVAMGVAGFIARVPPNWDDTQFKKSGRPNLISVDPSKEHGTKAWVTPKRAWIDSSGKVQLSLDVATPEAVAVHEGTTLDIPMAEERLMQTSRMNAKLSMHRAAKKPDWLNIFDSMAQTTKPKRKKWE